MPAGRTGGRVTGTLRDELAAAVQQAAGQVHAELVEAGRSRALRRQRLALSRAAAAAPGGGRLDAVLRAAVEEVPFYDRLRPAAADDPIPALGDFPILTKAALRDRFADLIRRSRADWSLAEDRYYVVRTSGSTGAPVSALKNRSEDGWMDAVLRERLYREHGVPASGEVFDLGLHSADTPLVELRTLPRLFVQWNLRSFDPSREDVRAEYDVVVGSRSPALVQGTSTRVAALARYADGAGARPRPALAMCSYEQLTDAARRVIGEVLGCPVVSCYGTAETGIAGWECRSGRMHFEPDAVVAEVVAADGSPVAEGGGGRLLLTSLKGLAMPIIRYDTGDRVHGWLAGCDCGRAGPAIAGLEGRTTARLVGRSGRTYAPYLLMSLMDGAGVPEFQVVQDVPGAVRIVVTAAGAGEWVVPHLHAGLRRQDEDDFEIVLDTGGGFVLTESGKRNPVVSRVTAPSDLR